MRLGIVALLGAACAFAQSEPTPLEKPTASLVAQIRRLAVSEPVVYGIDTRLRVAAVVSGKHPKLAGELLRESQAALTNAIDPNEADRLRVRMVELWAPLDFQEAERLIPSLHRGGDRDYVAQAYDKLCAHLAPHPGQVRDMVRKGLSAGAFRMDTAYRLLESAQKAGESDEVNALFSEILAAFPAEAPNSLDVRFLLDQTRLIIQSNRPLAVEAIDKSVSAALAESVEKRPNLERSRMRRETATFLESVDPELMDRYQPERKQLKAAIAASGAEPDEPKRSDDDPPDLSKVAFPEALASARKLENLTARAIALIDLSRREELSPQQRASVASEALSMSIKLPLGSDRLAALAIISRDYARHGELSNAAYAAQLLSETFSKGCDCQAATCHRAGEVWDCLQDVEDFAEYLDEFKISPESMSLDNISLEARLLVLKLKAMLGKN